MTNRFRILIHQDHVCIQPHDLSPQGFLKLTVPWLQQEITITLTDDLESARKTARYLEDAIRAAIHEAIISTAHQEAARYAAMGAGPRIEPSAGANAARTSPEPTKT